MVKERCDPKVYKKGIHVFTTHSIPSEKIEEWVKKIAQQSGQKVDWHYFAGRAIVKALGNIEKVRAAIKELMPEHEQLMKEAVGPDLATICRGTMY
ncbi:MAG: hypothetical protein NTX00_03990 [Candidatus Parcubacteria bacterium]|nr:hypothetical protein [Candidatus Parcubacteria bacterium]